MKKITIVEWLKSLSAYGSILFFVIMAFEVMIMISPFAFFFYSVFNPIFRWFDQYTITDVCHETTVYRREPFYFCHHIA